MESNSDSSDFLGALNYYCNLLLMASSKLEHVLYNIHNIRMKRGRLIVGAVLVAAGSALVIRLKNENNKKRFASKAVEIPQPTSQTPTFREHLNEIHQKMREEREREERQYEEERNSKIARKNAEKRARTERSIMEIAASDREDELNFMRTTFESDERLRKLMEEKQNEQFVKDKLATLDQKILNSHGKMELEEIERKIERSREIHQRNVEESDSRFQKNKEIFEKQESLRKEEILEHEEQLERRRREIEEQLEKKLEEIRKRNEQRRNEMDEQLRQIHLILQMKIWNEIIESNWTKRLNSLRSSNQDIKKLYGEMKRNKDIQLMKSRIKSLLAAVDNQKTLMENEKNELEKMYKEYGKSFLLVIKDSIDDVSSQCDRISYVLKHEPSNSAKIDECMSALFKVTMSIPTLAELKSQWKDEMI